MKVLIVGNGIIDNIDEKICKKQYDKAYFFCNNLNLKDNLKFLELKLVIQNFTLNFANFNDKFKYVRYFKALKIKLLKTKTKTILIGNQIDNKYLDYDNLLIEKRINHQIIIKNLINFIGLKSLFLKLKLIDFFKILVIYFGFKRKINSTLRPSSGRFLLIYLINQGAQVDTIGFTNPNKNYISENVSLKQNPHEFMDNLIFKKILK